MLLAKAFAKLISLAKPAPAGQTVEWESSDRAGTDVSRGLTPEGVDQILTAANSGDTADLCRLALEIEEKNWDIAQALQTRRLAVAGTPWEVLPGDDSPRAQEIAAAFEAVLRAPELSPEAEALGLDSFEEAVTYDLMGALLPGFAAVEIVWGSGGKTIAGFASIDPRAFTCSGSRQPLLVTVDHPQGVALPPGKFIVHRYRARSGDPCRGGLVRPLAWLDVFQRLGGMKDLLRFIERHGMPFLLARVEQDAWERDRNRLKYLIQNFGSSGGGIFTKAVELEMMQSAAAGGDVYFRLLEYCGAAITKVVLGQTATSGEAGGFSKGQAQENVRRDLLTADCAAIDATITAQVSTWWTAWNYGPQAPVPRLHHRCEQEEDLDLASRILVNLSQAGFDADAAEVSERFGYKLTRKAAATFGGDIAPMPPADDAMAMADAAPAPGPVTVRVPDLTVPASWGEPLRAWLAAVEAKANDPAVSDAELLTWLEAEAKRLPDLAGKMDVGGLAEALRSGMTAAAGGTVEALTRNA